MTEIDTDPNSLKSQQYFKQLEEAERTTHQKKPGQILIKTMKRGNRAGSTLKIDVGVNGQPLSEEE